MTTRFSELLAELGNPITLIALMSALTLNLLILVPIALRLRRSPERILHRISVMGLPNAGKTTLITRAFDEIIHSAIGKNVTFRGRSTIDLFNENRRRLSNGLGVLRTTTDEALISRFDYTREPYSNRTRLLPRALISVLNATLGAFYKVEIADFAGEQTLKLGSVDQANSAVDREADIDLVRWSLDADKYVFVINCSSNSSNDMELYAREQTEYFERLWMNLIDASGDNSRFRENSQVCLYFNKIDAHWAIMERSENSSNKEEIPRLVSISRESFDEVGSRIGLEFSPLIKFFSTSAGRTTLVFGSSFATLDGRFVGIEKFVRFTLPLHRGRPV